MGSRTRTRRRVGAVAAAVAAASVGVALGAPADLDPTFSGDGRALVDAGGGEYTHALVVQPDGKILGVGESSVGRNGIVFRLNRDGSPDMSFDGDAIAAFDLGGYESGADLALRPDGRMVAAGTVHTGTGDIIVVGLRPDGTADPTFGTAGTAILNSGGREVGTAVALQPDGKVVVAGYTSVGDDAAVYRLTEAGLPDGTFDGDGARGISLGTRAYATAVAVQPDGRILAAGYYTANTLRGWVARFTDAGVPDPTFGGGDGVEDVATLGPTAIEALLIQPDGKIVLAGEVMFNNQYDVVVHRLNRNGSPDAGFGLAGAVPLDEGAGEEGYSAALQPDGRIVVGGYTSAGEDAIVFRLRPDGTRDPSFGVNGGLVVGNNGLDNVEALAVQPDGGILIGGDNSANDQDALVVRLRGVDPPAPPPPVSAPTETPGVVGGTPTTPTPLTTPDTPVTPTPLGISVVRRSLTVRAGSRVRVGYRVTDAARITGQLRRGRRVVLRVRQTARAGVNTVTFRTAGRLAPGRYTLTLDARAGDRTARGTVAVVVTAPPRARRR